MLKLDSSKVNGKAQAAKVATMDEKALMTMWDAMRTMKFNENTMNFAQPKMAEFVMLVDKVDWFNGEEDGPHMKGKFADRYFMEIKDYMKENDLYQFLVFLRLRPELEDKEMLERLKELYGDEATEWHHKVHLGGLIAGLENNIRLKKYNFE